MSGRRGRPPKHGATSWGRGGGGGGGGGGGRGKSLETRDDGQVWSIEQLSFILRCAPPFPLGLKHKRSYLGTLLSVCAFQLPLILGAGDLKLEVVKDPTSLSTSLPLVDSDHSQKERKRFFALIVQGFKEVFGYNCA